MKKVQHGEHRGSGENKISVVSVYSAHSVLNFLPPPHHVKITEQTDKACPPKPWHRLGDIIHPSPTPSK